MALDEDDEKQGNDTVLLRSKDGDARVVKRAICMQSELLKTMLTNDKEADECPLPQVSTKMLDLIISYLTYHHENAAVEIEKPLKSATITEVVCKWDAEFIDVSQEMLFEFILAANFMDMKSLLDLACAKVPYICARMRTCAHARTMQRRVFWLNVQCVCVCSIVRWLR